MGSDTPKVARLGNASGQTVSNAWGHITQRLPGELLHRLAHLTEVLPTEGLARTGLVIRSQLSPHESNAGFSGSIAGSMAPRGQLLPRPVSNYRLGMQPGEGLVVRPAIKGSLLGPALLSAGDSGCCCITDSKLELDIKPTEDNERYGIGFTITVETTWKPAGKGKDCQILWLEKHMWSTDPEKANWDWVGKYEDQFPRHADKDAPKSWAARKKAGKEVTRLRDLPSLVKGSARDHEIHFIILLASGCEDDGACENKLFVLRQRTTLDADGQGDDDGTWIQDVSGTDQGKEMVKAWLNEGL